MNVLYQRPLAAACLLPLCLALGACSAVSAMKAAMPSQYQSSGTIKSDAALAAVAISFNENFSPNASSEDGDSVQGASSPEAIQRFTREFGRRVQQDLPDRLRAHHVAVRPPGRGMPLLRLYISSYRANCRFQQNPCVTELRVDAALMEDGGTRSWWYNDWVAMDDIDQATYDEFYRDLLDTMIKDQVIVD